MIRLVSAVLTPLLFATGCAAAGTPTGPVVRPIEIVLIDADATGAIVADLRQAEFRGVTRDTRTVWRAPLAVSAPDATGCAGHCPDALLSGNAATANAADVPGPPAVLVLDGRPAAFGPGGRTVLTANGPGDYIVTSGSPGRWTLEAVRPGSPPVRIRVPGPGASWVQTPDGGHALAVVPGTGVASSAAVWFTHTAQGWRSDSAASPAAATAGCLAPDGTTAMLLGERPTLRSRAGESRPVTDLEHASDCGLATGGGIVGGYGQDPSGVTARIRVFAADGTVVWRQDRRGSVRVTADPLSTRVAFSVAGTTTEIDTTDGRVVRTVRHAYAARYDGAGSLVVADENGTPSWLPAAA